jgi:hypothetical protein
LLVDAEDRLEVSGLMRNVAGEFARAYNRRKERINAYWGDNFHATLVEEGHYLWRCLCYGELNMVRCAMVSHPREWDWLGYHEIRGVRRRYRLLDVERLCWRLGTGDIEEVRRNLEAALAEAIAPGAGAAGTVLDREPGDGQRRVRGEDQAIASIAQRDRSDSNGGGTKCFAGVGSALRAENRLEKRR